MLKNCLLVGLGGFAGAVCRYLLGVGLARLNAPFPFVTMGINLLGAFVIGILTALPGQGAPVSPGGTLFLKVGLCGGFTTFSTFSAEALDLMQDGRMALAGGYAAGSVLVCLFGVFLGRCTGRALFARVA